MTSQQRNAILERFRIIADDLERELHDIDDSESRIALEDLIGYLRVVSENQVGKAA